jgi:hypothetical protein
MPSEYGDCCMGAECSMPIKTVIFFHHCIVCSGFIHIPCGVTDIDDRTTCHKCYRISRPNVGGRSPRKLAALFVEAQRRGDVIMAPTVALATQVRAELETQEEALGMQEIPSPPIMMTTRNRQKRANGTEEESPRLQPPPPPQPPKTTSHKKQKRDGVEVQIGLRKRVKVTHGDIFHVLSPNQQQFIPHDIGNSHPLFGKVIGGGVNKSAKKGWDIELDILPCDDNKVMNVLSVLATGEDEDVDHHLTHGVEVQIGLGKRVKVTHGDIFHVLSPNQQQFIPHNIGNSHPLFGKVIGGGGNKSAKKGWYIELDILPCDDNKVINVLSVLAPGEDEDVDHHLTQAEKLQQLTVKEEEKKNKQSPMAKCLANFDKLSKEVHAEAKIFTMTYCSKEDEFIDWEILGDQEYYYDALFRPPNSANGISSSINFECSIQENFFEHVFPSVVGHAKIIDIFLVDPRTLYHETDPDWKVQITLFFNCLFLYIYLLIYFLSRFIFG